MAYEAHKLVDKLKSKGLDVAEDAAVVVLEAVVEFIKEGAAESENKVDDLLVPLVDAVKPIIVQQLDKIDGKDDM
jgi:hypothetical protein